MTEIDASMPVKVLTGGYRQGDINIPESVVTKKPLQGVSIGNIRATSIVINADGQPSPFRHAMPPHVGCEPEMVREMVAALSRSMIKMFVSPKFKSTGATWPKAPIIVEYDWVYVPTLLEVSNANLNLNGNS